MRERPRRPRGRPRVPDAHKRVQVTITLSPEALRVVDALASRRKAFKTKRASRSRIIADAVDAGLMKLASDVLAEITAPKKRKLRARSQSPVAIPPELK